MILLLGGLLISYHDPGFIFEIYFYSTISMFLHYLSETFFYAFLIVFVITSTEVFLLLFRIYIFKRIYKEGIQKNSKTFDKKKL